MKLALSETPKTGFVATRPILLSSFFYFFISHFVQFCDILLYFNHFACRKASIYYISFYSLTFILSVHDLIFFLKFFPKDEKLVNMTAHMKMVLNPLNINGFFFLVFGLILYVPVNSYGHVGTVGSPNHTFFLGKLDLAVNQYFVYILSLVTDHDSDPS